ncbi:MAG: hypothetical protein ACRD0P_33820, partial [Stackebrandtia sp.]
VEDRVAAGVDPRRAGELAVAEFGDVDEIADEFQVELAALQARRALALLAVIGPVSEVASRIVWSNAVRPVAPPSEFAGTLATVVDVLGWASSAVAALLLEVFGVGARWWRFRTRFTRVIGYGLLGKIGFMALGGVVLGSLFGEVSVSGGARVLEMVLYPMYPLLAGYAGWLGWRCLRVGRRWRRSPV